MWFECLKSNILHEGVSDTEIALLNESVKNSNDNNSSTSNDKIVSGRIYSGIEKNEMPQLLIPNTLSKPSIDFNDIESMIASVDDSIFKM